MYVICTILPFKSYTTHSGLDGKQAGKNSE